MSQHISLLGGLGSSFKCETRMYGFQRHSYLQKFSGLSLYFTYYCANLLCNATLLAFYTILVTVSHRPCLNANGENFADSLQMAIMIGIFVLLGDFANSNIIGFFFRFKKQHEEQKFGYSSLFTYRMNETSYYLEWSYRLITFFTCCFQRLVTHSDFGHYCIYELGVLKLEGVWIDTIMAFQFARVLTFTIWHAKID